MRAGQALGASRALFRVLVVTIFALGVLNGAACSTAKAQPEPLMVTGIILGLTQRTFTELETIDIRTDGGEVLTFQVEGDTGLTPGHAREHMSFVEPVTIHYRETDRGAVAFLITD